MATPYHVEPEVVDRLLHELSTNEAFRKEFLEDYFGALKRLGHKPPPDRLDGPLCKDPDGPLAPMAEIAAAREMLRTEYSAGLQFQQNLLVSPVGRKRDSSF